MYDIEDIVWESVRRNYVYRKAYDSFLYSGLDVDNLHQYRFDDRLTEHQKVIVWEMISRWKLRKVYDPNISSVDLKEKDDGRISSKPYFHLFALNRMDVIEFDSKDFVFKRPSSEKPCDIRLQAYNQFFDFIADNHENRCLISVDCLASDKDIIQKVKEIKKRVGREIKDRKIDENLKIERWKNKHVADKECVIVVPKNVKSMYVVHPNKIDESFNHLERYDSVVQDIQSKYENWRSMIVDGVLVPPQKYRISDNIIKEEKDALILNTNVDGNRLVKGSESIINGIIQRERLKPESKRRSEEEIRESYAANFIDDYAKETVTGYFRKSYEMAASMIQLAPNGIRLQAKRVEK